MDRLLVLVGGGARTGKSSFALRRARELGARRAFIATAEGRDDEMRARIAKHATDRGSDFRTIEVPLRVADALRALEDVDVVVLDCLTIWLSNLLVAGVSADAANGQLDELVTVLCERSWHAVVVSNEVGMGVVPESALGRTFRDVVGRAHQALARRADETYVGILGCMLRLRPQPVGVVGEGEPT